MATSTELFPSVRIDSNSVRIDSQTVTIDEAIAIFIARKDGLEVTRRWLGPNDWQVRVR